MPVLLIQVSMREHEHKFSASPESHSPFAHTNTQKLRNHLRHLSMSLWCATAKQDDPPERDAVSELLALT